VYICRQLGMDLVPRIDGEQADADTCSITQLHRVHVHSAKLAHQDKVTSGLMNGH